MGISPTIENRFSTPVSRMAVPGFAEHQAALTAFLMSMFEGAQRAGGLHASNCKGWHSNRDLHTRGDPIVQWLCGTLQGCSRRCLEAIYRGRLPGQLAIVECWGNVNPAGAWNGPHIHAGPLWSGVFYVRAEHSVQANPGAASDGSLVLMNPVPQAELLGQPGLYHLDPKDGELVLFPGYLLHMVAPHHADTPRISVAFNMVLQR